VPALPRRRRGRVAEGGGLLNRYTLSRRIEGSNPSVSANGLFIDAQRHPENSIIRAPWPRVALFLAHGRLGRPASETWVQTSRQRRTEWGAPLANSLVSHPNWTPIFSPSTVEFPRAQQATAARCSRSPGLGPDSREPGRPVLQE
jgi:hypothetical protein